MELLKRISVEDGSAISKGRNSIANESNKKNNDKVNRYGIRFTVGQGHMLIFAIGKAGYRPATLPIPLHQVNDGEQRLALQMTWSKMNVVVVEGVVMKEETMEIYISKQASVGSDERYYYVTEISYEELQNYAAGNPFSISIDGF